jgi:hypothetical protein
MKKYVIVVVLILTALLVGCATTPPKDEMAVTEQQLPKDVIFEIDNGGGSKTVVTCKYVNQKEFEVYIDTLGETDPAMARFKTEAVAQFIQLNRDKMSLTEILTPLGAVQIKN